MPRMLIVISCALLCGATVFAQSQQSENFRITKSVLDAGGGASVSANFRLVSAFGQPTPIGFSSSANFGLSAGFLTPTFELSPLSDIQRLVILRVGASADMKLDWERIATATSYTIHRDSNPLFVPGPGNQIGTAGDTTFTDVGAVNLAPLKYYYNVKAIRGSAPLVVRTPGLGTWESEPEPSSASPVAPAIEQAKSGTGSRSKD